MRFAIDLRLRRLRIRHHRRRIEQSQSEASCKRASQRNVNIRFSEQTLLYGIQIFHIVGVVGGLGEEVRAFIVHPGLHRNRGGFGQALREVMSAEHVNDSVAIGDHISIEHPRASQLILEQKFVCASWFAVDPVVSAHHRFCLSLGHGGAEGGQSKCLPCRASRPGR